MASAAAHADEHHEHISPLSTYLLVYGALLVLTGATVGVSVLAVSTGMDHRVSLTLAMVVALTKATLVCAWFMHLIHDTKFNVVVFLSAAWFVALFFIFTMFDLESRGDIMDINDFSQYRVETREGPPPFEAGPDAGAGH